MTTMDLLHQQNRRDYRGCSASSLDFFNGSALGHCDQAHFGPVSSRGAETGSKDAQAVVGTGRGGCGRDADGGLGGGTDRGEGGYGRVG